MPSPGRAGFPRPARRLGVEHTTISRRLTALEHQLGVPLFYRTTGGYLLTPQGQNVLPGAEAMERAAVAIAARANETNVEVAGRVRVALAPEFASDWLVPTLATFRVMHPRIVLQVLVGTRQRDLSRGEAELSVQAPRSRQQGLVAVRIAHVALGLYASKRLAVEKQLARSRPDTLRQAPLLVYSPPFQMLQEAKWFQPILASATIGLETNSTHALLAAARADGGGGAAPVRRPALP